MKEKQATEGESKFLDRDAILNDVKHIRASLHVMEGSIDRLLEGDYSYFEANALFFQIEDVIKRNIEYLDRTADDLRKGGAKDYETVSGFSG